MLFYVSKPPVQSIVAPVVARTDARPLPVVEVQPDFPEATLPVSRTPIQAVPQTPLAMSHRSDPPGFPPLVEADLAIADESTHALNHFLVKLSWLIIIILFQYYYTTILQILIKHLLAI